MGMHQVIRFKCDEDECGDVPAMTELEAISHTEQHLRIQRTQTINDLETIWNS